jgi:transglutaminase-like putative cysteine protease
MKKWLNTKRMRAYADNLPEDSISLRMIATGMAVVGILAACQMADTPPTLAIFGILGTIVGSIVSYFRRYSNNFWIKWLIAFGILVVLRLFFEELLLRVQASIADAREPLTNMLIGLLALHCFDLPRRRDLNLSALVGLVLLAAAATLSRDLTFGLYLVVFVCFGTYMLYLDSVSRTTSGATVIRDSVAVSPTSLKAGRSAPILLISLVPLVAAVVFFVLPRFSFGFMKNIRVSIGLHMPYTQTHQVSNPLLSHLRRRDGSIQVDPMAYYGFDQNLDLNYRGRLSDQVVLRVGCRSGQYWRAMSFDTYDGHQWKMKDPDQTITRVANYGSGISLSGVPSLMLPRRLKFNDEPQVFYLESDQPNLIPAASVPYLIHFPISNVEIDNYGGIRSPMFLERDTIYTVFSKIPRYPLDEMRLQPAIDAERLDRLKRHFSNYLQLPPNLPSQVKDLSKRIAGSGKNWFCQAELLDNFLKRSYTYNLTIPPTPAKEDVVADFLFHRKMGYCEHFASAFVVMCRSLGIPARIVTGFTPGQHNPLTSLWEVRMQDAHAWAEIYFPPWGWVPFDSTPDGAGPGLPGKDAASVPDYFVDKMQMFFETIAKLPLTRQIVAGLIALLQPAKAALDLFAYKLQVAWPYIVFFAGAAIFVVPVIKLYLYLREKIARMRKHLPGDGAGQANPEATREYVKLCKHLQLLDIKRLPQQTSKDLIINMKDSDNLPDDLQEMVRSFVDVYSQERFGRKSHSGHRHHELSQLRTRIHHRVLAVASKLERQ